MRNHDKRYSQLVLDIHEFELGLLAKLPIQRREGFVQQQDFGLLNQRPRQCDTLTLTAGELIGLAGRETLHLYQFQNVGDTGSNLGFCQLLLYQAVCDVFLHGHVWKYRVGLKHHVDRALVRRLVGYVDAVEKNPSGGRNFESCEHAQQCCFAAAGSAEYRK